MDPLLPIAIVEAIVIFALVVAFLVFLHQVDGGFQLRERAWRQERAELLERIQRPERVPASQRPRPARRAGEEPRAGDLKHMAQIGAVVAAPPNRDPDPA